MTEASLMTHYIKETITSLFWDYRVHKYYKINGPGVHLVFGIFKSGNCQVAALVLSTVLSYKNTQDLDFILRDYHEVK